MYQGCSLCIITSRSSLVFCVVNGLLVGAARHPPALPWAVLIYLVQAPRLLLTTIAPQGARPTVFRDEAALPGCLCLVCPAHRGPVPQTQLSSNLLVFLLLTSTTAALFVVCDALEASGTVLDPPA